MQRRFTKFVRSSALAGVTVVMVTCALPIAAGAETDSHQTIVVSTCAPTGAGSLADAIANAADGTTISIRANCNVAHPIAPTSMLAITKSLTIIGGGGGGGGEGGKTTISGSAITNSLALIASTGQAVSLKNLNFINIGANGVVVGIESTSNLSISDCRFSGGSGVSLLNFGPAKLSNTTFSKNSSYFSDILNFSRYPQATMISLDHVTFDQEQFEVGGPLVNVLGTVSVNDSRFTNNSGGLGAGITNVGGAVTVSHSLFANNSARVGGAIYSAGAYDVQASLSIEGSTFINNTGSSSSPAYPGIWTDNTVLTIKHSRFNAGDDH